MELSQIRYFINLAETLSFTQAAELSGVTQPSLTKSIRRLESELGNSIIFRDGKHSRLTPLGRELLVKFMQVEMCLEEIKEIANSATEGRGVTLMVGVDTTIAPKAFMDFWSLVLKELPLVDLNVQPLLPEESENEILYGKYDLCILKSPPADHPKLVKKELYEEKLMLAIPKDHAFSTENIVMPETLEQEPYVDRLHCEFRTTIIKHFMNENILLRPRFQSDREDWVQTMIASGKGVSIVPERSVILDEIILKEIKGLDLGRTVTLVAISGSGNPSEVRKVLSMAEAYDWGR